MSIIQPACICGELLVNHPGGAACGTPPTGPRVCVREKYTEAAGTYIGEKELYDYVLKEWEFLYSDGTTETVTSRERVE